MLKSVDSKRISCMHMKYVYVSYMHIYIYAFIHAYLNISKCASKMVDVFAHFDTHDI